MKIPKRINPDNLKDTIVQILFKSEIPQELFLGVFASKFGDTFKFAAAGPKVTRDESRQQIVVEGANFLDKSECIKVNLAGNSITFNTYRDYPGWVNYFPVIEATIEKLFSANLITEIKRIGIRYISQFDNTSLIDNLNMNLSIDIANKNLEATQIRSEFSQDEFKVILTLINKIKQIQGVLAKDSNTSIIDIDVIQTPANMLSSKGTLEAIKNGHQKQKTVFFSLLKPAFLNTLNPEY